MFNYPHHRCQVEKGVKGSTAPRPKTKRPPSGHEEVVTQDDKPEQQQRELEDHGRSGD